MLKKGLNRKFKIEGYDDLSLDNIREVIHDDELWKGFWPQPGFNLAWENSEHSSSMLVYTYFKKNEAHFYVRITNTINGRIISWYSFNGTNDMSEYCIYPGGEPSPRYGKNLFDKEQALQVVKHYMKYGTKLEAAEGILWLPPEKIEIPDDLKFYGDEYR